MRRQTVLFLIIICLLSMNSASGDTLHYNNVLIGERAAGMGGAYRAVSDDASGSYYNPAGLALTFEKILSASVNAYSVTKITYENVFGGATNYNKVSRRYVGNFLGFVQTLGPGKLGLSVAIPDSELVRQDDTIQDFTVTAGTVETYKLNMSLNDNTFLFGPSYGIEITDRIAFGTTLYFHYRDYELNQSQLIFFESINNNDPITPITNPYEVENTHVTTTEYGLRPMLGLMLSPFNKLSIGLTYSKTMITSAKTNTQQFRKQFLVNSAGWDKTACTTTTINSSSAECFKKWEDYAKRKTPTEYALGIAFFPTNYLLFSADYSYYTDPDIGKQSTYNAALGMEYYITNNLILRSGLFTNNANTNVINVSESGQADHIDLKGGSLSITSTSRTSSISFGGYYSEGKGKGQVIGGSSQVQNINMSSYTIFLSGSHHL